MSANNTKIVADFLIADFEYETQTTLRVMSAVPAEGLDYRPDSKSKTALGLLRHLALEDAWILNSIADGAFAAPPDDSDACGIMTPADAASEYKNRVTAAIERVKALDGEAFTKQIDLLGMIQAPGIVFLQMAIKHSVHHRGQLSTYLRPMGGKVPGIYGPSGDMQEASAHA